MLDAVGRGLLLWLRNIPLLSTLVLTVWLPGNALINYVAFASQTEEMQPIDLWLPMLIDTFCAPLSLGAMIYALDRRWQGQVVGYFEALREGFRHWISLAFTLLVAELLVGLGFLLFVVPGILLSLRYSFVDVVVVLENQRGSAARRRSSDLMHGSMLPMFVIAVALYSTYLLAHGGLYLPLEFAYESTSMTVGQYYAIATGLDCVSDIVGMSAAAVFFSCYVYVSDRQKEPATPIDNEFDIDKELRPDDGNPYMSPNS